MGVSIVTTGGYVRLDLRDPGDFGLATISGFGRAPRELERDLETLALAARKRLDKYDDEFGGARVVLERESQCEFCGGRWTEESPSYNGGCCSDDVEAEEARTALETGSVGAPQDVSQTILPQTEKGS